MNVMIVNGNPDPDSGFDARLSRLAESARARGDRVQEFTLRELSIAQCVGCFGCWVKTPGICVFRDDQENILRGYVAADLVVMASPLIMGFTSALLKRCTDRIIPVLLPFIDTSTGECRHFLRYGKAPLLAVVYAPEPDTDPEDVEIAANLWQRLARNAGSRIACFRSLEQPLEEVWNELDRD
ncbi:flavodoxin family protein [Geomesophilobacter sediminis]|uniref:Flavodoxin family protein n=1 Tax=Geomesophilobacter sediminis TaxID=2798584 RepID=A0A8J7JG40_9BACT|nr:flavodoxin family protein [Geomesophilobacter sediminis]MBJ6725499.1 flavodoxin family protein [Geomesophilobacter sediminis]